MEDIESMRRLQAGDDLALNALMARWEKPLLSFIFRYLGNQEDAIDIAQETFVRVYQHRHSFNEDGKFSTWLFSIASNLCRNQIRWRNRHPAISRDGQEEQGREERDPGVLPWEDAQNADLAGAVRQHIQELPHDLRLIVISSFYEERSHKEIAEVLGCSAKAVESKLYRAKQILRDALAKWTI